MSQPGRGAVSTVAGEPGVSDDWPEVVRTAFLLTADHGAAEELAAAAFVQQRRRRSARSPVDARLLVLRIAVSLAWQLRARSRRRPDADDPFLAAYLGLSARERALLVLRIGDGLDGPAAATVLRLRPKEARTSIVTALDTLVAALPAVAGRLTAARSGPAAAAELDLGELTPSDGGDDRAGGDPLVGHPVVPRLAALFAELSAAPPVVADPARRVEVAVAHTRRRRNWLVVAVAGLVVAAAGGIALEKRHAADLAEQQQAARRLAAAAALNPVVQSSDVATWPTRGSLAGRADLLAQVREVAGKGNEDAVLAVPFLGEVDGLNVALAVVTGLDDGAQPTRRLVALAGSGTRTVSSWESYEGQLDPDGPNDLPVPVLSAALGGRDGLVRSVVVTVSREVSLAVSPRPQIDAAGIPTRRYTAVALSNGVGTLTWQGVAPVTIVRVQYAGSAPSFTTPSITRWPDDSDEKPYRQVLATSCRGARFEGLRLNLDNAASSAAVRIGVDVDQVAQVVAVGCRRAANHTAMIVAVRLVDGTALQTTVEEITNADGVVGMPGPQVRAVPRGREVTYPRVLHLSDDDTSRADPRTVVFAAPRGATAELVRGSGGAARVLARAPLAADGVGVGTATARLGDLLTDDEGSLFVVVRDAAGRELERVPAPAGHAVEPKELDGPVDRPGFPHRK